MSSYSGQEFNGAARVPSPVAETPSNLGNCTDLNSVCYNSLTVHGQMRWVVGWCHRIWALASCPLTPGIRLYGVEVVETGDSMDSKKRQENQGFPANPMKTSWGT